MADEERVMDKFDKDEFLLQLKRSMGRWILMSLLLMLAWAVFVEIYMRAD